MLILNFIINLSKKNFSDCEKHQWNAILSNNLTFFTYPLKSIGTITPKINRVFLRDYESQNLTEYIGNDKATFKTFLNYTNPFQTNCLCNNLLEEVKIYKNLFVFN